ncbi:hypothetical protein XO10_03295 [Marinitoga sp. 1135]|uniref:DnaJ-class molecular chaperone with C-terminal Zn finger domain n=1 Tax=Marinitoga piezophila (strain DSM 14283 / JCM 11233 / KA3) TaxID=443254 RepID=H2J626_MARPK|nr:MULTISPECIES: J domain-containing protein [Marinitoga]AEX85087.1 DnaJ-class molecular chaperone with C-terminal Zn finger domain [Marinitoga piezophila KA3]NUU95301.1 hypothetical protein [Marinitoga sp. 1135]NUU97235.1 hypothetical protein [Marinitoga sp. 1138]
MDRILLILGILLIIGFFSVISIFFKLFISILVLILRNPILLLFVVLGIYILSKNVRVRYYRYGPYRRNTYGGNYRQYRQTSNSSDSGQYYGSQNYYELRQKFDYYRNIFGLSENFTKDELKKRFRDLTKQYHPDRCKDGKEICEEKFKQINEAYEFLSKYARDN